MLALVTMAISASSSPMRQAPKLSARSELRSMTRPGPLTGPPLARLLRRQAGQRRGDVGFTRACRPDRLDQQMQHVMPVLAKVEQALRRLPELRRVAAPEAVGKHDVPVQVLRA